MNKKIIFGFILFLVVFSLTLVNAVAPKEVIKGRLYEFNLKEKEEGIISEFEINVYYIYYPDSSRPIHMYVFHKGKSLDCRFLSGDYATLKTENESAVCDNSVKITTNKYNEATGVLEFEVNILTDLSETEDTEPVGGNGTSIEEPNEIAGVDFENGNKFSLTIKDNETETIPYENAEIEISASKPTFGRIFNFNVYLIQGGERIQLDCSGYLYTKEKSLRYENDSTTCDNSWFWGGDDILRLTTRGYTLGKGIELEVEMLAYFGDPIEVEKEVKKAKATEELKKSVESVSNDYKTETIKLKKGERKRIGETEYFFELEDSSTSDEANFKIFKEGGEECSYSISPLDIDEGDLDSFDFGKCDELTLKVVPSIKHKNPDSEGYYYFDVSYKLTKEVLLKKTGVVTDDGGTPPAEPSQPSQPSTPSSDLTELQRHINDRIQYFYLKIFEVEE